MLKALRGSYSFMFWMAFALVGSYFVWPLDKHLRRGIDLVGGFYLTLKVDTDAAVRANLSDSMNDMVRILRRSDISEPKTKKVELNEIKLSFENQNDMQRAYLALKAADTGLNFKEDENTLRCTLSDVELIRIKNWAVESNVDILRSRLDTTGVAEVGVSRQGKDQIIVELPNVDDPARAKGMIGKAAQLEIRVVHAVAATEDELLDRYDGALPEGMDIRSGYEAEGKRQYLLSEEVYVTGKDFKDVSSSLGGDMSSEPIVAFEFTPDGSEKFYELTRTHVGKQLAILIDGSVISAPRVNTAIKGKGIIQGHFTTETAKDLAAMLKSGSYVAPVSFEEERRIGATLGQEAIHQGIVSCLIGLALLFIFSIFYYKTAGVLAVIALLYNLLLIIFGMAWLNATLTLPGIAGMVLTIGMAIDSSVLIYEKVRETLETGVAFRKSLDTGFSDAMAVILDSNITTFLAGVVLYKFGTGPIQGFAITLMLGIIATLLSGLFFLRATFEFVLNSKKDGRISI